MKGAQRSLSACSWQGLHEAPSLFRGGGKHRLGEDRHRSNGRVLTRLARDQGAVVEQQLDTGLPARLDSLVEIGEGGDRHLGSDHSNGRAAAHQRPTRHDGPTGTRVIALGLSDVERRGRSPTTRRDKASESIDAAILRDMVRSVHDTAVDVQNQDVADNRILLVELAENGLKRRVVERESRQHPIGDPLDADEHSFYLKQRATGANRGRPGGPGERRPGILNGPAIGTLFRPEHPNATTDDKGRAQCNNSMLWPNASASEKYKRWEAHGAASHSRVADRLD